MRGEWAVAAYLCGVADDRCYMVALEHTDMRQSMPMVNKSVLPRHRGMTTSRVIFTYNQARQVKAVLLTVSRHSLCSIYANTLPQSVV